MTGVSCPISEFWTYVVLRRLDDWETRLLAAYPSGMKAIGHSKRYDDGCHRTCAEVLGINDQTFALIFGLVMNEADQVPIVF
jgi:hypothetical protein